MQTEIEIIKELLSKQFNATVRLSRAQMGRTEFKVNAEGLVHSDLQLLQDLRHKRCCDIEVKRSGLGLVIIVIY